LLATNRPADALLQRSIRPPAMLRRRPPVGLQL